MQPVNGKMARRRSGFTLIELLTVIAIIAVLGTLLLTALASAKKKARTLICTSNLHQFSIALMTYMDESQGKRPAVSNLVSGPFLPSAQVLLCPEDKTGNWGQLVGGGGLGPIQSGTNGVPGVPVAAGSVNYSYLLQPLSWDDAEWDLLKQASSLAGVAACQLHGLGNQNNPDVRNYSGLLLRAQLDGSVIRRQFFWSPLPGSPSGPATPSLGASFGSSSPLDPLQIFFDNPANWQIYQ
jgi:prepilin-type N-terminal cleavage/methylation domain-containing protein